LAEQLKAMATDLWPKPNTLCLLRVQETDACPSATATATRLPTSIFNWAVVRRRTCSPVTRADRREYYQAAGTKQPFHLPSKKFYGWGRALNTRFTYELSSSK
jgi:hypothetical protein